MGGSRGRRTGLVHERPGGPTEWYTPPAVFTALGITFDVDPCSPGAWVVPWIPARIHLTTADDGLRQRWRGRVWLNPPYGPGLDRWLERFADHRNGIALIFARTDTQWFHTYAARADALCFTRGRIQFVAPSMPSSRGSTPGCGSVFVAYGDPCVEALRQSGLGWFLDLRVPRLAVGRIRGSIRSCTQRSVSGEDNTWSVA
jgi:hypothetical protein